MALEFQFKNKGEKYPWMIIYNGTESGVEYLSNAEHNFIISELKKKQTTIILKDERVFNAMGGFQRIVPNPNYVDPVEDEKKAHYYFLWNRYQDLKRSGAFNMRYDREPNFKFKTWYEENKEKLDKEYEETKK
jgi:hypothetical protein